MCCYAKGEVSLTSYGVPSCYPHFPAGTSYRTTIIARLCTFGANGVSLRSLNDGCF